MTSRTLWIFLIGAFVGAVVNYNYSLNHYDYKICFFGYTQNKAGKFMPIVRLRKQVKLTQTFYYLDEGRNIEIANIVPDDVGSSVEFTDQDMNRLIKEQYCR